MARQLIILFEDEEGPQLTNRIRNLGEDLYGEFKMSRWATIDLGEIDRATTELRITVHSRAGIGRTMNQIQKLLDRHNFADTATVIDDRRP